ncbi:MAG TPA: hypothetical protein H9700_14955 [Candidatus Eisenbergiella intestinipullorum]|nr:hypothetical protein [Candidatus Eisenbergiella intestinipullorum]
MKNGPVGHSPVRVPGRRFPARAVLSRQLCRSGIESRTFAHSIIGLLYHKKMGLANSFFCFLLLVFSAFLVILAIPFPFFHGKKEKTAVWEGMLWSTFLRLVVFSKFDVFAYAPASRFSASPVVSRKFSSVPAPSAAFIQLSSRSASAS